MPNPKAKENNIFVLKFRPRDTNPGDFFTGYQAFMSSTYKFLLVLIIILSLISGLLVYLFYIKPVPPSGEITYARVCLSRASKNKALLYSGKNYRQAQVCYDSAMFLWKKENEKFLWFRNYSKVAEYAQKSAELACKAAKTSGTASKNLVISLQYKIDSLKVLLENAHDFFNRVPLGDEIRQKISKGKILYREGILEFENGNFLQSEKKINRANEFLNFAYHSTYNELKEYFKSQPYWEQLVENTISKTEKNQSKAIIIDKFARKLYVYHSGKKKYEFDAEFGRNWMKRKIMKNDKATPEGTYFVKNKIPQNKTKYFRALLLNYPNEEDIERYNEEKKAGNIKAGTTIGNLIEIHGNGGKGIDWTDGCIALKDSDMLKVYNYIDLSTTVIIVGSIAKFKIIADSFTGNNSQSQS